MASITANSWTVPVESPIIYPIIENIIFDEGEGRKQFLEQSQKIMKLTQRAFESGKLSELYDDFLDNPRKYLCLTKDCLLGDQVRLLPYLSECACVNSGNFNRLTNNRRQTIEAQMVQDAVKKFPPSPDFTLSYVSLGCGELLQDFINIGLLMKAGYTNIEVHLIDTNFKKEAIPSVNQFAGTINAVALQKHKTVNISTYESLQKYLETGKKGHIIQAIDFDDWKESFGDILKSADLLLPHGKFYFCHDVHDLTFTSKKCKREVFHGKGYEAIEKGYLEAAQELKSLGKQELRLAQLSNEFQIVEWIKLIANLKNSGCKKVHYCLIHPPKTNFFGVPVGPHDKITPDGIKRFLTLLAGGEIEIEVKFINDIEDFKAHLIKEKMHFDHISWVHAAGIDTALQGQLSWLVQHCPQSLMTFALQGFHKQEDEKTMLTFQGTWKLSPKSGLSFLEEPEAAHKAHILKMIS